MHIHTDSYVCLYKYLNIYIHIACIHQKQMMLTLGQMVSQDQKCYVAPHFDHLDLRKVVVPLVLCGADTGANCVTWPWNSFCTSLKSYWPNKYNGAIYDTIGIIWCHTGASGITGPKSHVASHFDCLELSNAIVPGQSHHHHMRPMPTPNVSHEQKILLHLI